MNYKETDDIWRLYRREWVTVHTTDTILSTDGRACFDTAARWAADNLHGRVRAEDINVELNTDQHGSFWGHVRVFKDNLKGEFKYVESAQMHANTEGYDEYVIVPRNSKSDHDIRNYGIVKL